MSRHAFNFEGGDILANMGATWFVSYAYYENVDKNHLNWKKVSTYPNRCSNYERSRAYHEFWLREILKMYEEKLNTNSIGLKASETKNMAKKVVERLKSRF